MKTPCAVVIATFLLCCTTYSEEPSCNLKFPNAIHEKLQDKNKLIFSFKQPLKIVVSGAPKESRLRVSSSLFRKQLCKEEGITKDEFEMELDYGKLDAIKQPDKLSIAVVESKDGKVVKSLEYDVFPVRVVIQDKLFKSNAIWNRFGPNEDGRSSFIFEASPWDESFKTHLRFLSLPSIFCNSNLEIEPAGINSASGDGQIKVQSEKSGISAITAVLDSGNLWQECSPDRLSVYIELANVVIDVQKPTEDQIVDISTAMREAFPEPHDEITKVNSAKLLEIFHSGHIPFLPQAIKSMSAGERKELIRIAGMDKAKLQMAMAAMAIRIMPLPSKVPAK